MVRHIDYVDGQQGKLLAAKSICGRNIAMFGRLLRVSLSSLEANSYCRERNWR